MATVTPNINQARAMRVAVNRIEGFAKQFGEAHRNLARHAAFPLVLTPDLLYQIWANFVPEAPWIAVAHLLLSRLCRQVGYETYEIDIADRNLLLRELKEQFRQERLDELGEFLLDYVAQRLTNDDPDTQDLAQAQEWTVLAYTKPNEAASELAEALSSRVRQQDMTEVFRLASLVETFAEPLTEFGFEPLLVYARGMGKFALGNQEQATVELSKLVASWSQVGVTNLCLEIPPELLPLNSGLIANSQSQTPNFQVGFQSPDILKAEANRLSNQAIQQFQDSQFRAALQSWQQALKIYREIGDRVGEVHALDNIGLTYNSIGQYQKAIEHLQQTLVIAQELGDRVREGRTLANLGSTYRALGQYQRAIEYQQQTLVIAQEIGDIQGEQYALVNLGDVYRSLGNYAKAIDYYQQSLGIAQQLQDLQEEGRTLGNLGVTYYSLGDYSRAIDYYQQSLAIAQQLQDSLRVGQSLSNLGLVYDSLGDYSRAIDYYQQSLAIAQEIGDRQGERQALVNLGLAYDAVGEYSSALNYSQRGLAIAREIGDIAGEAMTLSNIGSIYTKLGQYSSSLRFHQQALKIQREIGDRASEETTLNNIGTVYKNLGQYEQALEYYQQALTIAREIGKRAGEDDALNNLGLVYFNLGQYKQALEYYQQALTIAREIQDISEEREILNNLGLIYFNYAQYSESIEYYQRALTICREIKDRAGEGETLNNLGNTLFKSGDLAAAEKTLMAAIEAQESLRSGLSDADKVSIFERQAQTYRTLQQVLVAQGKIQEALAIAERGRARTLVELLADRLSSQATINPPTIQEIQQIARKQNATIVEYSILNKELAERTSSQYQEAELFIWVIQSTGDVSFRQVDLTHLWEQQATSITNLVSQTRRSLGVNEARTFGESRFTQTVEAHSIDEKQQDAGIDENSQSTTVDAGVKVSPPTRYISAELRQLHQLLIEPIADLLPLDANASVIFIPQDALFLLPFPALQDATGKFLIEQHTILTAPSIQVLELTHKQRQRVYGLAQEILIVGNPTMPTIPLSEPPRQLNPLPGAEAEAKAIAALLNTQPVIGDEATKLDIVQQMLKTRLIHLATHGIFDDTRQLGIPGAMIALAPSEDDNGFLTAGEILNMNLNAELVVLSGGSHHQITNDSISGLSRSFLAAGVPSLIEPIWSVSDQSTQFLMTKFYQNLQNGMNKAQALRQAMLATMERYRRPKSWAGFTLIGEAE